MVETIRMLADKYDDIKKVRTNLSERMFSVNSLSVKIRHPNTRRSEDQEMSSNPYTSLTYAFFKRVLDIGIPNKPRMARLREMILALDDIVACREVSEPNERC